MKRTESFCDTPNCRNVAEGGTCVICTQDFCRAHGGGTLALSFGAFDSNATIISKPERALCLLCRRFFDELMGSVRADRAEGDPRPAPQGPLFPMLEAWLATLIVDVKVLKAAHALGARGEDLRKAGGRA